MLDKEKYSIYYKNNKFQQIRGFCNVVIFDGISNAARQMGLSQSAVSHQIGSLEEDLKLKLFTRIGNKMVLTEDGQRFYNYVIPTLKQMDNIYEEFLIENDKTKENELRIGAYHYAISRALPKSIASLKMMHPKINITIENLDKKCAIEKLRDRELDLIFYPFDNDLPDDIIVLRNIIFNPTILAHKNNRLAKLEKITMHDLTKENILLIDSYKILPIYTEFFKRNKIRSYINFINTDWEMLRFFVKEDLGITFFGDMGDVAHDKNDDIIRLNVGHIFPMLEYRICSKTDTLKNSVDKFMTIFNSIY